MALTYAIEGKGVIANADNYGTDTAGGSWGVTGSGGASAGATTDTFYYGTTSISSAVSGSNKWAWIYHDIGSGNELDFGASGTEEDQFIYIWVHCPTIGLSKTLANEGVSIRVGSGTSDYRTFIIAGSDDSNGWDGGWQCFVIDPTQTGSIADTGTPNLSSIRYIGPQLETTATAKGDNLFVSQIAVGSGMRITGTSTTAWADTVAYTTDLANRAWGMMQEREGIYYAYGNIIIGSNTSTTDFDDEGRIIQFGLSEYWSGTGTTFDSALPTTASGITLDDAVSNTVTFTDGVIVGTENGRSGSTIIGNANEDVFINFGGLVDPNSDINLYGTTFKNITGTFTLEADPTGHVYYGVNFIGCEQVSIDPAGDLNMKNSVFAETASTEAAFLWNNSITTANFTKNAFIANTTGAAIEHPDQGSFSYQDLSFSGNTFDILYSDAASSGVLTINASDSNPSTSEITNATGNSVSIVNTVTLKVTVRDQAGTLQDANVRIQETDGTLISQGATTSGVYTDSTYNYTIDTAVQVRVRESSPGTTRYFSAVANGTITSTGLSVEVALIEDTIASAQVWYNLMNRDANSY